MNYVDHWQVYAGTAEQVKSLYRELTGRNEAGPEGQPKDRTDGGSRPGDTTGEQSGDGVTRLPGQDGGGQSGDGMPDQPDEETGNGAEGQTGQEGEGVGDQAGDANAGQPENGSGEPSGEPGPPEYVTVEDDYFSDAVFIGDSRTVGMYEYGELEEIATFYASTGLTVYKLFDSAIVSVPGQKQKITVEEALQNNSFSKIYLMVGINEMGTGTVETFIEKYKEVAAHLQELQPEAILYIQGIMKVTTKRSEQGDYINNEGITARNEELEKLADNSRIFYLDVNPVICDETGGLVEDYTFDGVHLKAKYIQIWKDYLKQHAIQK